MRSRSASNTATYLLVASMGVSVYVACAPAGTDGLSTGSDSDSSGVGASAAGDGVGGSGAAGGGFGGGFGGSGVGGSVGNEHCDQIDILFVIENSPPMQPEQQLLAANFPAFFQTIDTFTTPDGDLLQYRVAVTSTGITTSNTGGFFCNPTTPGDDGRFRQVPPMPNRWLERTDPDVSTSFSQLAAVGNECTSTCHTMPLQAMKLSLSDRIADGYNAGYLREEALLALVFLTDRDDCSSSQTALECIPPPGNHPGGCPVNDPNTLEPVATYVDFLDDLKGGRERWAAAVIAAPPPSSCQSPSGGGTALPASRLSEFITQTGENGVFSTVCADDLTPALEEALNTFMKACEDLPPPPE